MSSTMFTPPLLVSLAAPQDDTLLLEWEKRLSMVRHQRTCLCWSVHQLHPGSHRLQEVEAQETIQKWVLVMPFLNGLQEAVRHHPHPDARERCAALLHSAQGRSPHWVARHGLLVQRDHDSIYQWLRFYQQEGLTGLLSCRHGGPHRRRL